MSGAGAHTQSSRTPYDHLRFYYPETWKRLSEMFEKNAAVTNLAGVRRPEGLRHYGAHDPPIEKRVPFVLSAEQKAKAKEKKKYEDEAIHQLNLLKNTKRNPFGSWYEGLPTNHKIACVYNERMDGSRVRASEPEIVEQFNLKDASDAEKEAARAAWEERKVELEQQASCSSGSGLAAASPGEQTKK